MIFAKIYKIIPILHFKQYISRGFGSEFITTIRDILFSKFGKSSVKIYVDCGSDNILSIKMATEKIEYIKLRGNSVILKKIKSITDKNKVLLNPTFNIVDCRNTKNINFKIKKIYSRLKNEN